MNSNQNDGGALLWAESPTRPAGFRQTLTIGDAEYGFCWIPAGEFDMGSPESELNRDDGEVLHHVKLTRGFWLLETPTTQAFYHEIMGTNQSRVEGDDRPVERVIWFEAVEFCEALTRRLPKGVKATLPTEAQWEYACRAGTKTAFWFGDAVDFNRMNYDDLMAETTFVKSYPPNPWGLYDMHGNVCEWQLDWFVEKYSGENETDPQGPVDGSKRVCRGGSWYFNDCGCRSASRFGQRPDEVDDTNGFRVLLSCDCDDQIQRTEPTPESCVERRPQPRILRVDFGELGASAAASKNQDKTDLSLWSESPTRPAGFRQTLTIGDAEYGFCWIPPGKFFMGDPESNFVFEDYERETLRRVKLTRGFWLLETPTTQRLYQEVMGTNPSYFKGDDLPVERVSWFEANEFCETLTRSLPRGVKATLPTMAQWEYACRAGTRTSYWHGDSADSSMMNYGLNVGKTTPVKRYPANPWGLYDVHGNVCEWQLDYYEFRYESKTPDFVVDPTGPDASPYHMARGGSWNDESKYTRSAESGAFASYRRGNRLGFRFLLSCD